MKRLVAILFAAAVASLAAMATAGQDDARLSRLFDRLKETGDPVEANVVESMIWRIWLQSGRDDVDGAMARGVRAMATGEFDAALGFFNRVIELAPTLAEGWNKRATLYYLMENYAASEKDVEKTLALEPRHFGALSGLGLIYMAIGDEARAIKAIERALAVHPHLGSMREALEHLKAKTTGRPI